MGFFGGEDAAEGPDQGPAPDRLPDEAQARLTALRDGSMFTSGLSVNEFALLGQLGPLPLAQVMGASVVRTGWQYLPALAPGEVLSSPWYGPIVSSQTLTNRMTEASPSQVRTYLWHAEVVCELEVRSDAWNLARRRALDRLAEEARQVGADTVVGVRLHRGDHDLGTGTIDYVVTGTAVRDPNARAAGPPALTDVSVQDYWRLRRAGHEPVALVASTAVVFASPSRSTRASRVRSQRRNQELGELSSGFHLAREVIRSRLRGQVSEAGGTGAVGVEFVHAVRREKLPLGSSLGSVSQRGWHRGRLGLPYYVSGRGEAERRGWVITMHAAGTAIRHGNPARWPVRAQVGMGAR